MKKVVALIMSVVIVAVSTMFVIAGNKTKGDVNKDGSVTSADALEILRYVVGMIPEIDTDIADVNSDGKVNSSDALEVLKIVVGLVTTIATGEHKVPDLLGCNYETAIYILKSQGFTNIKTVEASERNDAYETNQVIKITPDVGKTVSLSTEIILYYNPYATGSGSGSYFPTGTTSIMEMPMEEVYNRLAVQRKFGFNKGYDKFSGLANFFLDTITAYFEYDDKYWLIEFWKGEYAIGAVGCEIGFYTKEINSVNQYIHDNQGPEWLAYGSVKDEDAMKVSMKMWQYQTPDQTTPVQKIDYNIDQPHWWAADFATGSLYKNSDRTSLVMVGSIQFPNPTIRNLFVDAMKEKGFTEGTINAYHNVETLQVEGNKVTVCWKNYADAYQVSSSKGSAGTDWDVTYPTNYPYTTTKKSAAVTPSEAWEMVKDLGKIVKAGVGEIVMDEYGNYTVNNHPGQDTGLPGYKYSTTEKCFVATEDSWPRNFGFEETYDNGAGIGAMSYDTIRVPFVYDGKEWMIQLWKGQYGLALIGAEIGIYTRPAGSGVGTYYTCATDDEKLTISMDLYRRASSTSSQFNKLFSRNPFRTWWLTGFVPGTLKAGTYVVPEDQTKHLRQDSKIVFDTPEQAQAFVGGLNAVDHIYHNSPARSRAVTFKEFSYSEYDAATSTSAKYALMSDGKTVRFSWR